MTASDPRCMFTSIRRLLASLLAIASVAAGAQPTSYPTKPVRVIVGFVPGSATDITGRIFAQKFSEIWGVPVTVDNIPGAGGSVGAARAAKAPADGYTLLWAANGAMTIAPGLQKDLAYDPSRDFAPISLLLTVPSIVMVSNDVPARTFQELIALARAQPGKLSYASPGSGTPQHIAGELLKILAHIDVAHVPYRGAVVTDVIAGRVPITIQNAAAALPFVRDGKLRPLAVTSLTRLPSMPELPTIAESGYPGFEATSWFGIVAPAGTPMAIIAKVQQDALRILALPDMKARLAPLALEPAGTSPEELAVIIKADVAKWTKLIKEAGITASD